MCNMSLQKPLIFKINYGNMYGGAEAPPLAVGQVVSGNVEGFAGNGSPQITVNGRKFTINKCTRRITKGENIFGKISKLSDYGNFATYLTPEQAIAEQARAEQVPVEVEQVPVEVEQVADPVEPVPTPAPTPTRINGKITNLNQAMSRVALVGVDELEYMGDAPLELFRKLKVGDKVHLNMTYISQTHL